MTKISIWDANRKVNDELQKVAQELGCEWEIGHYMPMKPTSGKNYTAKGGAHLFFNTCLARGQLVTVLFQPGDNTGNEVWTPREKQGEAELYISLGSSIDEEWFSGLTCLDAIDKKVDGFEQHTPYKELTTQRQEYLERIGGDDKGFYPRRFDFTFDREGRYGDPHVIGMPHALAVASRPFNLEYQVGAFVAFPEKCEELDILREKVRDGYLAEGLDKGEIKL